MSQDAPVGAVAPSGKQHKVQVWFGTHVISTYLGDEEHATRYEHAMQRRFPSLVITNEEVALDD